MELGESDTYSCPSDMFCLGNGELLGGSQTTKDQLDLTATKIDTITLILNVCEDDFAFLDRL